MTVIACPKCKDEVRVPARASAQAKVRCPLCTEEYLLADALAQLPPELILVSGAASEELDDDPYRSPVAVADSGADYSLAGAPAGASEGLATAGVFDTAGPGSSEAAVARPQLRGGARPKRKEKSMVGEMVKVVMGGVVGIGLAIPIIWWLGDTDPFELGPKVSPYAPWMVPARFHAKKSDAFTTAANTAEKSAKKQPPQKLQTFDGGFDPGGKFSSALNGGTEQPEVPSVDIGANPAPFAPAEPALSIDNPLDPAPAKAADEPVIDDPLAALGSPPPLPKSEPPPPDLNDLSSEPNSTTEPATAEKKSDKKKTGKSKPAKVKSEPDALATNEPTPEPAPEPKSEPKAEPNSADPPTISAADLTASLDKATAARAAFDKANAEGADNQTRRNLATEMFNAVSAIAPVVSQLSLEDADNYDQVTALKDFLTSFTNPSDQTILAYLADQRLNDENSAGGIVLAGTVKDFKAVGSAFETTVELANKKRSVQVVTFKNPQDQVKIDEQVVIVGKVVRDPATNLKGYEGAEPLVVSGGYVAVLPAQ